MYSSGYVNGIRIAYLLTCFVALSHFLVNDYHFFFGDQQNKYECVETAVQVQARGGTGCGGS